MKHSLMQKSLIALLLLAFGAFVLPAIQAAKAGAYSSNALPVQCTPCSIDDAQCFVTQQYRDVLGREPDSGGLAYFTGQITQCGSDSQCIAAQRLNVARAFWECQEFRQGAGVNIINPNPPPEYYNLPFLEDCYAFYLHRLGDDQGLKFWLNSLSGCTADPSRNGNNGFQCYNDVINAFINSAEYRARLFCAP